MGLNFSGSRHMYLHQFKNEKVVRREYQTLIRLQYKTGQDHLEPIGGPNPFSELHRGLQENEQAVITGMFLRHVSNETKRDFEVTIGNLFDVNGPENQDANHPDYTGKVHIPCKQLQNAPVPLHDSVLYRPKLSDDTIEKYAGTEEAILNTYTIPLTKDTSDDAEQVEQVFPQSCPLIMFIMDNSDVLPQERGDLTRVSENPPLYRISDNFLNRVRTLFRNTIFNDIRYTSFEDCRISCPVGDGTLETLKEGASVCFNVQMVYYVTHKGTNKTLMKDETIVV